MFKKQELKIQLIDTITRRMLKRGECIISKIAETETFEWLTSDVAKTMDDEYYLGRSGYKPISVLYHNLLKGSDSYLVATTDDSNEFVGIVGDESTGVIVLTDDSKKDAIDKLIPIIINKYSDKWNKLYDAFIDSTYKPLDNYNMDESITIQGEKTTDDDLTYGKKDAHTGTIDNDTTYNETFGKGTTNTRTYTNFQEVDTESGSVGNVITGSPTDAVYPSFSTNPSNVKRTTQDTNQTTTFNQHAHTKTTTGSFADALSGNDTHTGTAKTKNTFADDVQASGKDQRDIHEVSGQTTTHTRSGNIGVTTSQQMLQSEIDLRNNFNLINQIYEDIDKIVTKLVW